MKAWDENGFQRDASAHEIHRYDQMHMRFRDITEHLLDLQRTAYTILHSGDGQEGADLAQLHQDLSQALQDLMSEGPSTASTYVMYLISIICSMQEDQERRARLADVVFRAMSLLLPEDHQNYGLGADINDINNVVNEVFGPGDEREPPYTTGTGQKLVNVHKSSTCEGFCVVHNPCPGPWEGWTTNWRGDGPFDIWRGFERACPCGVFHPAVEEILRGNNPGNHNCCGVCRCSPADCTPHHDAQGKLLGFS